MQASLGHFDVAIVGAGMAGASLAYELATQRSVLLLEQESQAGYHTTGRSAALFSEVYGNDLVRALSRLSRPFFDAPGADFGELPLLTTRGAMFFGGAGQLAQLSAMRDELRPHASALRWLEGDELRQRLPALCPEFACAGLFEPHACDVDVHTMHQGYLRGARRRGAKLLCQARLDAAELSQGRWLLGTSGGQCSADVLVNAAGAWADDVAALAAVPKLGLTPMRRTALVFEDQQVWDSGGWPLAVDVEEQIYIKPDAGRLLASPADETPSAPCDAQPDEYDLAVLLDRLERMTLLRPKRITGRWAGLRTFAPDRSPVLGFDRQVDNFFWLAGQGGYGIQTAPALAQFAASQIVAQRAPESFAAQGVAARDLSPLRFSSRTEA